MGSECKTAISFVFFSLLMQQNNNMIKRLTLWSRYLVPLTWMIRSLEISEETDLKFSKNTPILIFFPSNKYWNNIKWHLIQQLKRNNLPDSLTGVESIRPRSKLHKLHFFLQLDFFLLWCIFLLLGSNDKGESNHLFRIRQTLLLQLQPIDFVGNTYKPQKITTSSTELLCCNNDKIQNNNSKTKRNYFYLSEDIKKT